VKIFIAALGSPILGTKVNCRTEDNLPNPDHTTPFRTVADIILEKVLYYIVWANRAGSKTYSVGGFPTWYKSIIYDMLQTKILGGSEGQSILSYEAMKDFFRIAGEDVEREHLAGNGLMRQRATFKGGSEVSILTASSKSVRGQHPQILLLDEVDEMDETIYEDALSLPQDKYGIPGSLGMFSTNHKVSGLMDKAIAKAVKEGTPVYKFCIWECLESCKDYNCSTCKLSPFCPGIHMKEADGYYKIKDFIKKLDSMSLSSLQRDWFCLKIGTGLLVYENEYNEKLHLVGRSLRDAPVDLSLDWGGVDPFSCGVWQEADRRDGEGTMIRIAELYLPSVDASVHNGIFIQEAKKAPWWRLVGKGSHIIYDSSRPDLAQEWKAVVPSSVIFIPCDKKSIDDGVEAVKNALAPVGRSPWVLVNRICQDWIREVGMYTTKKITDTDYVIVDKNNHAMDETRYYIKWKFGKKGSGFFATIDHNVNPR